ncbi:hypothetical protein [uncultured Pseudodesulfovibrio sp.]|uniref:hypothetical protein n=1 Tax=uncultured Pseudodesulfovibrio sp. TaxID=2035858 RepID=UPI0029C74208|nr:hypothetical protein [uncultured Pseudodesulfovibrio sp.]
MKRLTLVVFCLFAMTVFFGTDCRAEDSKDTFIHFTVLPQKMPSGADSWPVVMEFKTKVMELAGGFTELGPSRGGSLHPDSVHHEENLSFLIAADRDISADLKKLITSYFNKENAFILVWQGKMVR